MPASMLIARSLKMLEIRKAAKLAAPLAVHHPYFLHSAIVWWVAAPSATPVKHASLKVCNKQADAKKLTGPARAQFVKDCRSGKSS